MNQYQRSAIIGYHRSGATAERIAWLVTPHEDMFENTLKMVKEIIKEL